MFVRTYTPLDTKGIDKDVIEYNAEYRRIYNRYYRDLWYQDKNNRAYQKACVTLIRKCFPQTTKAMEYYAAHRMILNITDDRFAHRREIYQQQLIELRKRFGRDPRTGHLLNRKYGQGLPPERKEAFDAEIRALRVRMGRDPETGHRLVVDENEPGKLVRITGGRPRKNAKKQSKPKTSGVT